MVVLLEMLQATDMDGYPVSWMSKLIHNYSRREFLFFRWIWCKRDLFETYSNAKCKSEDWRQWIGKRTGESELKFASGGRWSSKWKCRSNQNEMDPAALLSYHPRTLPSWARSVRIWNFDFAGPGVNWESIFCFSSQTAHRKHWTMKGEIETN